MGGEEQMTGYPFFALYGGNFYAQGNSGSDHQEWAIKLPLNYRRLTMVTPRFLPLRPLWPGFVLDTIFYALLAAALLCAGHGGSR